jgi:type I restriction-modification system DNA methylase subunit
MRLLKFADAEGKLGGEFYTPRGIVRLLSKCWKPTPAAFMPMLRLRWHVR